MSMNDDDTTIVVSNYIPIIRKVSTTNIYIPE